MPLLEEQEVLMLQLHQLLRCSVSISQPPEHR